MRPLEDEAPRDAAGLGSADAPVFREPWEAKAFALAVSLHAAGAFSWNEWADALGAEIGAAERAGEPDIGGAYYRHWLAALEKLVVRRGLSTASDLAAMRDAWDQAARNTPHGEAIELGRAGTD